MADGSYSWQYGHILRDNTVTLRVPKGACAIEAEKAVRLVFARKAVGQDFRE